MSEVKKQSKKTSQNIAIPVVCLENITSAFIASGLWWPIDGWALWLFPTHMNLPSNEEIIAFIILLRMTLR